MFDINQVRSLFPGTRGQVFLDAACVSLMPRTAAEAMSRLVQILVESSARDASAHHIALDQTAQEPRYQAAKLIGARPEDIALIESTTHGLEIVAASVPLDPGDKLLVGSTDFLGLAAPWIGLQAKLGIEIETVPHRGGRLLVDDFATAVDAKTRMILLSSVQWTTGYRPDLSAFSSLASERGLVLVVDAIQHLGAIGLDVRRTPVDFLVCGGHKWLNAPVGRGFMYVGPRARSRFQPAAWGYLNIKEPTCGWSNYFASPEIKAVCDYEFVAEARRFEIGGTANYPGNTALGASLALINEIGKDSIEAHIVALTDLLIDRLQSAGAMVVTPPQPECRSGIVSFTLGNGPKRDAAFLKRLLDKRILVSQRYTDGVGGLRVSVHFFNNAEDVCRLIEAVIEELLQATPFASDSGLV